MQFFLTCLTVMMMVKITAPNFDIVAKIKSCPEAELTAVRRQSTINDGCWGM